MMMMLMEKVAVRSMAAIEEGENNTTIGMAFVHWTDNFIKIYTTYEFK